ncbi:hypothetical protein GQ55_2G208600 [Panicum hallii var. hallii]|uniref:Uncharacterized protein n=1 Tax=Panicum hallii var. hallii TaxID=1504633 RepID=A0A2T7EQV6_9POAL|nr:hypothetical protein GQ55_2G208600 [Panicum hallii var. hallii]
MAAATTTICASVLPRQESHAVRPALPRSRLRVEPHRALEPPDRPPPAQNRHLQQPNRPSPSLNRPLPPPEERRGRLQQRSQTISLQLEEESCYSLHRRRRGVPLPPANLLHPLRFLQKRAKWVLKMKRKKKEEKRHRKKGVENS